MNWIKRISKKFMKAKNSWLATVLPDGNPADIFCIDCALKIEDELVVIPAIDLKAGHTCPACGKENSYDPRNS